MLSKFLRRVDWNWSCVLSVFEKFRFRLSTRTRENGVFKKFQSGERFRKVPFSSIVFIAYVWTEAVSVNKKLRSQVKTHTCGQGCGLITYNGSARMPRACTFQHIFCQHVLLAPCRNCTLKHERENLNLNRGPWRGIKDTYSASDPAGQSGSSKHARQRNFCSWSFKN